MNRSGSANLHSKELFDEEYGARRPDFYSGLLSQVILHGRPGLILDLGAGLGLSTELAYRWGLDVVGLEGSTYAVEKARDRVEGMRMLVHNLGDALPFGDETVANIVLNQVVEHLDLETFCNLLPECHRVLANDGRIFVYSPSKRNTKEKSEPTHINLMLPSALEKRLKTAGFVIMQRPNEGFWFAPISGVKARLLSKAMLRVLPHDLLSASANAIARKPSID